jgi:tRNA pseudouridine13 synthase
MADVTEMPSHLIESPLGRQRLLRDQRGIGGRLKMRTEDFLVDEIPRYEPRGEGEHLYLHVEKNRVSHQELVAVLHKHFGTREVELGYAGMKDKIGITRQFISLHLHNDPPSLDVPHERIKILGAARHGNKLRRGHLIGNRFVVKVRDVDPMCVPRVKTMLDTLVERGVPNHFGPQRFGYRLNNHLLGALLIREDYEALTHELLGLGRTPFPEYQRERREAFDAGDLESAARGWTASDRSERRVLGQLRAGKSIREAVANIGRPGLRFWASAFSSAVFNRVVDQRIERDTLHQLQLGDLAFKHDNRSVFSVTEDELHSGELNDRLARLEISPSGPLWGHDMIHPAHDVEQHERDALLATGVPVESVLRESPFGPDGTRRPLRVPVTDASVEGGVDEHGGYIALAFALPRGSYATTLLQEIMQVDDHRALTGHLSDD